MRAARWFPLLFAPALPLAQPGAPVTEERLTNEEITVLAQEAVSPQATSVAAE